MRLSENSQYDTEGLSVCLYHRFPRDGNSGMERNFLSIWSIIGHVTHKTEILGFLSIIICTN